MNIPYHLGGHLNRTHVDNGALDWAIKTFKIKSFLDVGCGPGGMVELASLNNLKAIGIDGDYSLKRFSADNFVIHDYTTGPLEMSELFDLIWSCEFVEHVEEKFVLNFLQTFKHGKFIIMTFAPPNTPGHHHVNCKNEQYWIDMLQSINFKYDDIQTQNLRQASSMTRNFVRDFGLFFSKS